MSGRLELVRFPLRSLRRAGLLWAGALAITVVVTVAVWPAFAGTSGISAAMDQLPSGVVDAFGLRDMGTPAGFLRGNLYELLIPLLLSIAAVAMVNAQTASAEESGRFELLLSQPVRRTALLAGRAAAVGGWLVFVTVIVLLAQLGSDAAFDVRINFTRVAATVTLCGLLASLHGAVAFAVAGWTARPAVVLGTGLAVMFFGYLANALLPLATAVASLRHASPWDWALGGDPLVNGAEPWRFAALAIPAILIAIAGIVGFSRRDVLSP